MIEISPATQTLVETLSRFSGKRISRPHDLGILLEIGSREEHRSRLEELIFLAKFVRRTYGIMERIGKEGEGYDRLSREFSENLGKASELIRTLTARGSAKEAERFETEYFAMTHTALTKLLSLMYDLEWYKNWQIDQKT
jgi:hypothetical protein